MNEAVVAVASFLALFVLVCMGVLLLGLVLAFTKAVWDLWRDLS